MSRIQSVLIMFAVLAVLVYMSAFKVDERELAIKFQFGEIVKSDFGPGLYWMVPFLNNVQTFDKRIQQLDKPAEQYLTAEKTNMIVDAFVQWRIVDVAEYYRATEQGDARVANDRLAQIINNALKNQISQRTVKEIIATERAEIMNTVRKNVDEEASHLGISVVDVRIKKMDYDENISGSVHDRMISARVAVAKKNRSEGQEEAKFIRANADRQREEILAEAYRKSESIRGEGDATASATYARAYSKNPEFYEFYRSLNAYKDSFDSDNGSSIMVLKPDSEFFKYFKNPSGGR
ncbi:MAG TPA: protease modulator HflC [Gammaproteobacteria bacterium]|nr:protease modulator HflC [Gammaproteobacteria bacterium]